MHEQPLLKADCISFRYPSTEEGQPPLPLALAQLSLTVERGSLVAVLGHNGCGKSTLAKHFNAICLPESGTVTVLGMDTKDESNLFDIRQKVGMVFQNPDNQIVATIVEEDVAFALENLGMEPHEMRRRVEEVLEDVGMSEFRDRAPHQLSGGQKQRVAIAGIVAMRPDCIVLDEPTAMLDPRGRAEVMRTIQRLNRQYGTTIVLITHYMDEAAQAQRVVVMEHGSVLMDDTPRAVFSRVKELQKIGLDVPQPTQLCDLLKQKGVPIPIDLLTVSECVEELSKLMGEQVCQ